MRALILVAVLALAGCAADRTVRDVEAGAEAIELACTEALPLAQMAALIPDNPSADVPQAVFDDAISCYRAASQSA